MGRVLILDGRQRSTLAAARSLGRAGIEVTVGEDSHPCLASSSKYCANTFLHRSAHESPAGFTQDIINELKRQKYDLLLPMTDITSFLAMQHQEEINDLTTLPMPAEQDYNRAIDKGELVKLCEEMQIPVPRTIFINQLDDLKKVSAEFSYPVVVKPRQSKYLIENKWVETSVSYANSVEELTQKFKQWDSRLPYPMVQERLEGSGEGAFLLFCEGQPGAIFFHRRLREKPPSGGVSVLRESIEPDEKMRNYSLRLLEKLNWHGVAMVEFKYDNRDQLPKVIEINARFWGSLQLGLDAGVDFPTLLYRMAAEGNRPTPAPYTTGIKSRWLWGDIDSLLIRLTKPTKRLNLPPNAPSRLRLVYQFAKFWQRNTKYEVLKFNDLGPFLHETKDWFVQLLK